MPRSRRHRVAVVLLTLVAGTALAATDAGPAAATACTVSQLTDVATSGLQAQIAMDADGDRIVVSTSRSLDGSANPGNNEELWLIDVAADTATQLTVTSTAINHQAAIDDAGDDVVFVSQADLDGSNPEGNNEIWHYSGTTSTVTAITDTATGVAHATPDISSDGTTVVYSSAVDGNLDVYLHTLGGSGPDLQVTTTSAPTSNSFATIDDAKARVAYTSNSDGNFDVHLRRLNATPALVNVSNNGASNFTPEISDNGARIAFTSSANLGGTNPDGSFEVFQHLISTGVTTGLTASPAAFPAPNVHQNRTGLRVVHADPRNLLGENADLGGEVFAFDRAGDVGLDQVTDQVLGGAVAVDSDDEGTRLAYISTADPFGVNSDGSTEVFLAECGAIGPSFSDVPGTNPFYDRIEWMVEQGVAGGFPNGTFRPRDPVKRGQMANFLYNLAGQPIFMPPAIPSFSDVPTTHPFFLQIEWMVDEEVAGGFPNGTFKPNDPVKRTQMANFLYNLASEPSFVPPTTPTFSDVPSTHPFFLEIEWMADEGIAGGFPNGTFKPADPVKREQMANFVFNYAVCCPIFL